MCSARKHLIIGLRNCIYIMFAFNDLSTDFGFALIQMNVTENKDENNTTAVRLIRAAVQKNSAKAVMLPENFNTPHGKRQLFERFAETIPNGDTSTLMSNLAKELKIYLILGSMPERDEQNKNQIFNTMVVFGPDGTMLAKHRQMHVLNIKMTEYQQMTGQTDYITAGNKMTMFEMEGMKVGMAVCTDMFYGEMATYYRKMGADLILYAMSYPEKMGEQYNQMVLRTRAIENQVFVFGVSGSRMDKTDYAMFGHSMFVDIFGRLLKMADYNEEILFQLFDFTQIKTMRAQMPIFENKRTDMYETNYKM